jgi:hypothetical protein
MAAVNSILGARVRIEYGDHNESFRSVLPVHGRITRHILAEHGVQDWFLVSLDRPFDFEIEDASQKKREMLHCEKIIIRSRLKGQRIGGPAPASVFILLIRDEKSLRRKPIIVDQFYHAAWGECHTERT